MFGEKGAKRDGKKSVSYDKYYLESGPRVDSFGSNNIPHVFFTCVFETAWVSRKQLIQLAMVNKPCVHTFHHFFNYRVYMRKIKQHNSGCEWGIKWSKIVKNKYEKKR